MRPICPLLRYEARGHAFTLDLCEQGCGGVPAGSKAEPDHTYKPAPLECAEVTELELETGKPLSDEPVGDCLHDLTIDTADKPDGQVQIGDRRPTKIRRDGCALGEEAIQFTPVRFGHGKPEKRTDIQRPRAFQFSGTQVLGRVGRQPKCTLTESMPSATLGIWTVVTSSGVKIGLV